MSCRRNAVEDHPDQAIQAHNLLQLPLLPHGLLVVLIRLFLKGSYQRRLEPGMPWWLKAQPSKELG